MNETTIVYNSQKSGYLAKCWSLTQAQAQAHLPSKKYLETLCGIYDLDLFSLNTGVAHNPDFNLYNHRIQSRYFSPHSFNKFKSKFPRYTGNSCFSLLHNNVRSLKRNLENFQVHLLDELDYDFSLIGVSL